MGEGVPPGCEGFDLELGQLAAGVVDPAEVPEVADHLEVCIRCRLTLDELSATADRLALLGPEREPPPGFEARALRSFRGAQQRGRSAAPAAPAGVRGRWWPALVAVAAAIALVAGVAVGRASAPSGDPAPQVAAVAGDGVLRAADGASVGTVVALRGDRTTYVMELAAPEEGEVYDCEVVGADGHREPVGTWKVRGAKHSWTGETERTPAPGDRLELVDEGGDVAASATVS